MSNRKPHCDQQCNSFPMKPYSFMPNMQVKQKNLCLMFEAPIENLCPQSISPSFFVVSELSDFTGSIADQVMTKFLRLLWLDRAIWLRSGQWNVTDVICATSTKCPVNERGMLVLLASLLLAGCRHDNDSGLASWEAEMEKACWQWWSYSFSSCPQFPGHCMGKKWTT